MTPRLPAPALSPDEQATVARFDAAPVPVEVMVETVARATWEEDPMAGAAGWRELTEDGREDYRRMARAAIAAMPASPAEEAVKRVEAIAQRMRQDGIDSYAGDGEDDEIVRARAVALYYAADELLAALSAPLAGQHTTDEEADRDDSDPVDPPSVLREAIEELDRLGDAHWQQPDALNRVIDGFRRWAAGRVDELTVRRPCPYGCEGGHTEYEYGDQHCNPEGGPS